MGAPPEPAPPPAHYCRGGSAAPHRGRRLGHISDAALSRIFHGKQVRCASAPARPPGVQRQHVGTQTQLGDAADWNPRWRGAVITGNPPAPPPPRTVSRCDSLASLLVPCLWRWAYGTCADAEQAGRRTVRDAESAARGLFAQAAARAVSAAAATTAERQRAAAAGAQCARQAREGAEAAAGHAAAQEAAETVIADLRQEVARLRRGLAARLCGRTSIASPRSQSSPRRFVAEPEEGAHEAELRQLRGAVAAAAKRADLAESRLQRARRRYVDDLQESWRAAAEQEEVAWRRKLYWHREAEGLRVQQTKRRRAGPDVVLPVFSTDSVTASKEVGGMSTREWEQVYRRAVVREMQRHVETQFASFQTVERAWRGAEEEGEEITREGLIHRESVQMQVVCAHMALADEQAQTKWQRSRLAANQGSVREWLSEADALARELLHSAAHTFAALSELLAEGLRLMRGASEDVQRLRARCVLLKERGGGAAHRAQATGPPGGGLAPAAGPGTCSDFWCAAEPPEPPAPPSPPSIPMRPAAPTEASAAAGGRGSVALLRRLLRGPARPCRALLQEDYGSNTGQLVVLGADGVPYPGGQRRPLACSAALAERAPTPPERERRRRMWLGVQLREVTLPESSEYQTDWQDALTTPRHPDLESPAAGGHGRYGAGDESDYDESQPEDSAERTPRTTELDSLLATSVRLGNTQPSGAAQPGVAHSGSQPHSQPPASAAEQTPPAGPAQPRAGDGTPLAQLRAASSVSLPPQQALEDSTPPEVGRPYPEVDAPRRGTQATRKSSRRRSLSPAVPDLPPPKNSPTPHLAQRARRKSSTRGRPGTAALAELLASRKGSTRSFQDDRSVHSASVLRSSGERRVSRVSVGHQV